MPIPDGYDAEPVEPEYTPLNSDFNGNGYQLNIALDAAALEYTAQLAEGDPPEYPDANETPIFHRDLRRGLEDALCHMARQYVGVPALFYAAGQITLTQKTALDAAIEVGREMCGLNNPGPT